MCIFILHFLYILIVSLTTDKLIAFSNPNTPVDCFEVIGADHIYFGKEEIVGKQIAMCLDKNYLQNSNR